MATKKTIITFIVSLLLVSSLQAQDPETPKREWRRSSPEVQLLRPSLPAQRYNFELHRWEKTDEWPEVGETRDVIETSRKAIDLLKALPVAPKTKANRAKKLHRK